LDALGLPYVGAAAGASRVAYDKPAAKHLLERVGVHTPRALTLTQELFADLGAPALVERVLGRIGLPLIVKPAQGGSALGCTVVREATRLPDAFATCFSYDRSALIEQLVDGVEVAVAVIDTGSGPQTLPAVEIAPLSGVTDYAARYTAGATEFFVPARLTDAARASAQQLAETAHDELGLRDLSRTDAIVDAAGIPWFLEVNVAPGLTETSLLPLAARAAGLDLAELYAGLVRNAARRP
jgi:D-alanine-D-alanine ligase